MKINILHFHNYKTPYSINSGKHDNAAADGARLYEAAAIYMKLLQ